MHAIVYIGKFGDLYQIRRINNFAEVPHYTVALIGTKFNYQD